MFGRTGQASGCTYIVLLLVLPSDSHLPRPHNEPSQNIGRRDNNPVLVRGNRQPILNLSRRVLHDHVLQNLKVRLAPVDPQMDAALGHVDAVEQHVPVAGGRVARHEHGLLPLVDVLEDRGPLAGVPGQGRPQGGGVDQGAVGLLVVGAVLDLQTRAGQGARAGVPQQRGHADDVLRRHVVAILGVRRDHAHDLFRRRRDHVHGDVVARELVVELDLAWVNHGRVDGDWRHDAVVQVRRVD